MLNCDLNNRLLWYRRIQWGMLVLFLLFAVAVYAVVIRPANTALDSASSRFASVQNELTENQARAKNLPLVEMGITRLRQQVKRFDKKLPRQQELAQFMNDVARISQDASLRKLSWHLDSKPQKSDRLTELPVQFTFEGDFQSGVVQFLQATEDMQQLTRVRRLNIRADDAHDGQVKADITMNIYFGDEQ